MAKWQHRRVRRITGTDLRVCRPCAATTQHELGTSRPTGWAAWFGRLDAYERRHTTWVRCLECRTRSTVEG